MLYFKKGLEIVSAVYKHGELMTTLLFPGQGSQEPNMGNDFFARFSDLVSEADDILGYSIAELCQDDGTRLNQTCYTQPALFIVSCLMFEQWKEDSGGKMDFAAGHSVGEYAALYASGCIDFASGVKMVHKRGALMHQESGGGMAAVIGLNYDIVSCLLEDESLASIDIANLNAPEQIIVSGLSADVMAAEAAFINAGAKRYIPLKVSGAFHSRYMTTAAQEFRSYIENIEFMEPAFPVIANLDARPYDAIRARDLLAAQIHSSVRWVESIQYLRGQGEMDFIELGPGKVLSRLLRRI
ncbi:MAG: ACP S-malonyltransferase [Opitutae bacterium]|nr:ACP S-malonyltransferase [Opitutae bacterium]